MSIETQLQQFIETEIAYDEQRPPLSRDEPLLEGVLDSTDVLRLVVFLEEQFGIRVADHELVPEHFGTLADVAAFVRSKSPPAEAS